MGFAFKMSALKKMRPRLALSQPLKNTVLLANALATKHAVVVRSVQELTIVKVTSARPVLKLLKTRVTQITVAKITAFV